MSLLDSRILRLGVKDILYSVCVHGVMLYGSKNRQIRKKNVIRLKRNDARMVRWMRSGRPEDRISVTL